MILYSYDYGYGTTDVTNSLTNTANMWSGNAVWGLVALVIAVILGIVLYFTFLNPKSAETYTGFTKKLYDFLTFKKMTLEAILKICYMISAIFITLYSFSFIASNFLVFVVMLVFGNVITRVCYEGAILILMIYHKLSDVYNVLDKDNTKTTVKKEDKKAEKEEK